MKEVEVDMHIHSYYSDGSDSPKEIVKKAKTKGLKALSLTDHDVYQGLNEFMDAASEAGINAISGIEITSKYKGIDVHVLGYGIDCNNKLLMKKVLKKQWMATNFRSEQVLKKYSQLGLMRTKISDIRNFIGCKGPAISVMHIMVYRSRMFEIPIHEAKKEIGRSGFAWVDFEENSLMSPEEAVYFIKRLNGIPVLAHPGEFCYRTNKNPHESLLIFFEILEKLQKAGLVGIEAYHSKQSHRQSEMFVDLAKKLKLMITAGSDYHGHFKSKISIGTAGMTCEDFLKFKEINLVNK